MTPNNPQQQRLSPGNLIPARGQAGQINPTGQVAAGGQQGAIGVDYGNPSLQWIELSDFTPGIYGEWFSNTQPAPDGAAQIENTWGCVASPTGGLQPAPRIIEKMRQPPLNSGQFWNFDRNVHILAFKNTTPITALSDYGGPTTLFPDKPAITFSWFEFQSSSYYLHRVKTRIYHGPILAYRIYYPWAPQIVNYGFKFSDPPATSYYDITDTSDQVSNANVTLLGPVYYPAALDLTRVNKANPTLPGNITLATASGSYISGPQLKVFPDPDTPTVNSSEAIGFSTTVETLLTHQDRIIGIRIGLATSSFGGSGGGPGEAIEYTAVNNSSSVTNTGSTFVEENPSGYGTWASNNASELFLCKRNGGAVVVRGDIANPTVVRLPGVASTGDALNVSAPTPVGLVYGSTRGVWLWTGGDSAQNISQQLDGWFWKPPLPETTTRRGPYGKFSYQYPYIFAPNGYIMDTRLGSWFRIANPAKGDLSFWDTSSNGNVLGVPAVYSVDGDCTICSWFDLTQGCSEYSWQGQPLQITRGRTLATSEVVVIAQGYGTLTITVEGIDGESDFVTFQIASDRPRAYRERIAVQGHDLTVRIEGASVDDDTPAPKLARMALGYGETSRV